MYIRALVKAKTLSVKLSNICVKERGKRTREYYNELEYKNVTTRGK